MDTVNVIVTSCRESQNHEPVSGREEQSFGEDQNVDASPSEVQTLAENAILSIWPNPNSGNMVHLKWEGLDAGQSEITIRIYDALGKSVYLKTIQKGHETQYEMQVDFWRLLASGVYTVETVHGEKTLYQKLVVR